jgi:hypothetical protein
MRRPPLIWTVRAAALVILGVTTSIPPTLAADGGSWPAKAQRGPFLCQAAFPLSEIEPALRQLDALPAELQTQLGIPTPNGPIHVYLFGDAGSYQAYLHQYFPQVECRRALTIRAQGVVMIFAQRGPNLSVDLRHEGTHTLMQSAIPQLPLWLDEGLALYFERGNEQERLQSGEGANARPLGDLASLQKLERNTDWRQFSPADYAGAGAWSRLLLDGPAEVRAELAAYLEDLRRGPTPFPVSVRLQSLGKRAISTQLVGPTSR